MDDGETVKACEDSREGEGNAFNKTAGSRQEKFRGQWSRSPRRDAVSKGRRDYG